MTEKKQGDLSVLLSYADERKGLTFLVSHSPLSLWP